MLKLLQLHSNVAQLKVKVPQATSNLEYSWKYMHNSYLTIPASSCKIFALPVKLNIK